MAVKDRVDTFVRDKLIEERSRNRNQHSKALQRINSLASEVADADISIATVQGRVTRLDEEFAEIEARLAAM